MNEEIKMQAKKFRPPFMYKTDIVAELKRIKDADFIDRLIWLFTGVK